MAKISTEAKLVCDEDDYVKSFNPALMEVATCLLVVQPASQPASGSSYTFVNI